MDLTLEVIQHAVILKKGPLMRVGGPDGTRLARAAFGVIIKFSEQVPLFQKIWDEVEQIGMTLDDDLKGSAKLAKIAAELKATKQQEFEILCTQWE